MIEYLSKADRLAIYDRLLAKNGLNQQMWVFAEETGEANQQLSKVARGIGERDRLAEELADVMNCTEQMVHYFHLEEAVERWRDYKARRSLERAESEPDL